jgi:hypothetical protein
MRPANEAHDHCLKLKAVDQDDLHVIAACLQDALIPLSEMAFLKDERRFLAAFTRFRREDTRDGEPELMQCQCVLNVEGVEAVRYRGIDPHLGRVRLELLTILPEPDPDGGVAITLLFAGDAAIQLRTTKIDARLQDFGDCWPARAVPRHAVVAQADG